jgi:hypothetical protein
MFECTKKGRRQRFTDFGVGVTLEKLGAQKI